MNVRLLRIRSFAIGNVLMFALGFVLISTTQLLPQMAQSLMGYDATTSGLTLGVAGIITIMLMPAAGILTGRVIQAKYLAAIAFAGSAYAMWFASGLNLTVGFWDLSETRALQAMWLPFLFIPINSVALVGVPADRNNEASALINLMRNLGGSVGISYTTTLLAYREQFHHARLAEHVTPYTGFGAGVDLQGIAARVQIQAATLSYVDIFAALALVSLIAVPLALCLPRMPKGAAAPH